MAWKSLVSYWSIAGLAAQSSRWEQAMNTKLLQMVQETAEAASLQASAVENQAMAAEALDTAATEKAEAVELQEESAALLEKAEADAAIAAAEEAEVEGIEVEIAAEEEQAAAHAAVAAMDEVTSEGEFAESVADAAEAARVEAQAHGEEIGIGICELVPVVDIACDVIGGLTAVGLESLAAAETVKAAAEFASATAVKAEEEREVALAAELQAKAGEDAVVAAELQAEQVEEANLAAEETLAGEEKAAAAEVLLEQAEVEQEVAVEKEALAAEEQREVDTLAGESLTNGVLACWDAIMAGISGLAAAAYFAFRLVTNVVVPAATTAFPYVWRQADKQVVDEIPTSFYRDLSYCIHHGALFALTAGIFADLLGGLEGNSLKARGGIILAFAFVGSCLQTILLHVVPNQLANPQGVWSSLLQAARWTMFLSTLFVLELLIVWVNFGSSAISQHWLSGLGSWFLWVLFLFSLRFHIVFLEVPMLTNSSVSRKMGEEERVMECVDHTEESAVSTETDALLPLKQKVGQHAANPLPTATWFSVLQRDLSRLQLPFEILMASCMFGLLIHCISSALVLWPASKALLLSMRPPWLIPFGVAVGVIGCGLVIVSLISR